MYTVTTKYTHFNIPNNTFIKIAGVIIFTEIGMYISQGIRSLQVYHY